tara:strand:- start:1156 stop:1740 length:585 start_codon:yes stop_codon:yes gene_type:complete
MKKVSLFETPMWQNTLPDSIDTSWLTELAYEKYALGKLNECNGFQTFETKEEMSFMFPLPQGLKLQEYLDNMVNNIAKELGLPMVSLLNYWLNINPTGAYNNLHKHRNALLVGNLYLKVPDTDSGGIEFVRDDDADYYVPTDANYNPTVGTRLTIQPQERDIIVFPGWQSHAVKINKHNLDRVSLSFNYGAITQ